MLLFSSYDQLTDVVCVSEVGFFIDLNVVVIMSTRRLTPAWQIVIWHWRRRSPASTTVAGAVRVEKRTDWSRCRRWDTKQEAEAIVGQC
jgi:hypothetical protein